MFGIEDTKNEKDAHFSNQDKYRAWQGWVLRIRAGGRMLNPCPKSNAGLFLLPLVVLLMGLILTGIAWRYVSIKEDEKSLVAFNLHARDTSRDVQNRIKLYFGVLQSAGSFFAGSDSVTRSEWNTYVDFLKPKKNYPGIEGMGVIRCITNGQKREFENAVRRETGQGNAAFAIYPPGVRETYFPVTYFWPPLADLNLLGLDHGAYPEGFKALEMARDSGMVTMSTRLPYAKDSNHNPPLLFIFPIYRKGLPITTIDERRKALWGAVYARVNVENLFRDAISSSVNEEVGLEVFEGGDPGQETPNLNKNRLIYDADPSDIPHALNTSYRPRHHATEKVRVDGTTWWFYSSSRPGGVIEQSDNTPLLVLLVGSLLSIGASYFTYIRNCKEKMTRHFAYHDNLTGLPNRMLLQDRFQQALANAQRHGTKMALLFLDLDNFKPINDSLGHDMGDKVLKAVTDCSSSCLREGDTLSRLGGDEFAILLLNITREEEAAAVAQKILDTISRLCFIPVEKKNIHLSGSIGISMFPKDGANYEELLKNADAAMYRAKEAGRNNFQFYD